MGVRHDIYCEKYGKRSDTLYKGEAVGGALLSL